MTEPSAVRVRGLRKRYRTVTAVDGVDLDIAYGEVFALLGSNGAGKTTTVEILKGYRRRDGGEVRVLGEDPQRAGRARGLYLRPAGGPTHPARSIFSGVYPGTDVTSAQYLAPSMIAAGIASTTFVNLGIGIATDRDDGTLKRLRCAPVPPVAYFFGKIVMALVITVAEVVLLLAIGVLLFDLMPTEPRRWSTFAWVFLLGVTACVARDRREQPGPFGAQRRVLMNLPYLVLAFISGIFFTPLSALPDPLITLGSLFPLKWMAQGFRSVFLPDTILSQEVVAAWEHGRIALVLAVWCIGGLLLCLTTFRWRGRRDG